jgi:hypothetical protein
MQLGERVAQLVEFGGVDRNRPQNTTCCSGLNPGRGSVGAAPLIGDRIADLGIGHALDGGGEKTDLAGA